MKEGLYNILIVLNAFPALGGVAKVSRLLAARWQEQGHRVDILSLKAEAGAEAGGFTGRCLYLPDRQDADSPANREFIRRLVLEEDYQIIVNQGTVSSVFLDFIGDREHRVVNVLHGCPAWLPQRARHMSFVRQVWPSHSLRMWLRYAFVKCLPFLSDRRVKNRLKTEIEASSAYVVLTDSYKRQMEKWFYGGVPQDRIRVIPNPVPPVSEPKDQGPAVLYAGRYTKADKHPERLLRIWQQVGPSHPDWRLCFCGEGPQEQSLRRLARRLRLTRVDFLPPCWDDSLYEGCSLLCQTSSYEGMSLAVLEAQAAGVVPVVFDSGPWLQIATVPGQTAVVVPAFDLKAFARELSSLMEDAGRRAQMAREGRRHVLRFDPAAIAARWTELFKSLPL